MKDQILATLAKHPNLSNADLCLALGSAQSSISRLLTELHKDGAVKCKHAAHGKKLWYIPATQAKPVIEPYMVERTLGKVREIKSLFEVFA